MTKLKRSLYLTCSVFISLAIGYLSMAMGLIIFVIILVKFFMDITDPGDDMVLSKSSATANNGKRATNSSTLSSNNLKLVSERRNLPRTHTETTILANTPCSSSIQIPSSSCTPGQTPASDKKKVNSQILRKKKKEDDRHLPTAVIVLSENEVCCRPKQSRLLLKQPGEEFMPITRLSVPQTSNKPSAVALTTSSKTTNTSGVSTINSSTDIIKPKSKSADSQLLHVQTKSCTHVLGCSNDIKIERRLSACGVSNHSTPIEDSDSVFFASVDDVCEVLSISFCK